MHFSFLIAALIMPPETAMCCFLESFYSGVFNTKPLNDIFKGETLKGQNATALQLVILLEYLLPLK